MKTITRPHNALEKMTQMGDITLFEPAGDSPHQERHPHHPQNQPAQGFNPLECIAHLSTPKGPKPVLKTMMTTACERNCFYCPFRAGRGAMKRVTFSPDAVAGAFDTMQRSKKVDGIFLSSGIIKGSVTTQDKIIDTIEIIRKKYDYRGYVHLKIMPGAEDDQLLRAMQLADRISVNLEAPTQTRLNALAPKKLFTEELLGVLQRADKLRRDHQHSKLASVVTQFVVGAVGDTDLELLSLSEKLYSHLRLARVYYSAFNPVAQTPFEELPPASRLREFRLYQSSFLLRDYGWNIEELPFENEGFLPVHIDPKVAWADRNLREKPVDIARASREELMRVPNIGRKTADQIIKQRRTRRLEDIGQLRKIGVRSPESITPYILLNGKQPPIQPMLF